MGKQVCLGIANRLSYSAFMASAGLVRAAFRICQIKVASDIPAVMSRVTANIHQDIGALLAKFSRYLKIASNETGREMMKANPNSLKYLRSIICMTVRVVAPFTLRMAISRYRC